MPSAVPLTEPAFAVWRTFTRRLALLAIVSMALAWPLAMMNRDPASGMRDPFYVAVAWQFAVWGAIDLAFALNGERGLRQVRNLDPSPRHEEIGRRRGLILGALRFNRWLNALWVAMGVALLIWGYRSVSPSLVGHGVGVSIQAVALIVFDRAFFRALNSTHAV